MEEANKLIGAGKRHLVMGNAVEAVNVLQEACGMLGKKFGDTADECGEAFFLCGKALLDLARMENTVLGNALEGVPEEDTEEEEKPKDSNVESTESVDEDARDELRVQVYDAMAEKKDEGSEKADGKEEAAGTTTQSAAEEAADGEGAGQETEDAGTCEDKENVDAGKAAAEPEKDDEDEGGDDDDDDDDDEGEEEEQAEDGDTKDSEEEEVGNLQLAWEMLEVAKVIYKRKESKEDQLIAAQIHLKLGEVSSESGNYAQALEDFQECLNLQLHHLEPDSRLLAETHYQLGLTHGFNCQYSPAIEQFNHSVSVIKARLAKLQQVIDSAEGPESVPEERKEMEELKALMPEIEEKVEDAKESLKSTQTEAEDGGSTSSAFFTPSAQNGGASTSSMIAAKSTGSVDSSNGKAPVSDISHLVRKKRKPEESPVKENGVKKLKPDEPQATGTETLANGEHQANGDAGNKMEVESQ